MAGQKNVHGCFWLLLREIELGGKFLKQIFVINNFLFLSTINTLIHHSHNKPTSVESVRAAISGTSLLKNAESIPAQDRFWEGARSARKKEARY